MIRLDKSIVEGLQDIILVLEDQLRPLVQAELSLLVDILYRPELLFPTVAAAAAIGDTASVTVAASACGITGFINRYCKSICPLHSFYPLSPFSYFFYHIIMFLMNKLQI